MKAKLLLVALVCILVALAAWTARTPNPVQADDIPEKYRDTARKGLAYLIKNQFEDGHWEGDGGRHPVAMTGLVGLALLMEMENNSRRGGLLPIPTATHSVNIRKAADWLMEKSQIGRDGLIFSDHPSETARYMEGHGLATLFLAGVCKDERDAARRKRLTEILARAVQYIVKARSTQGGWHHTSKAEGHDFALVSTTVIQIQALQAAENANIPVPDDAIRLFGKGICEQGAIRPLSLRLRCTQCFVHGVRSDEWIGFAQRQSTITRPLIGLRSVDHPGANRIELDIATAGQQVSVGIDDGRLEATFPARACATVARVEVLDKSAADDAHEARCRIRCVWRQQQMHMIRHKGVRVNGTPGALARINERVAISREISV